MSTEPAPTTPVQHSRKVMRCPSAPRAKENSAFTPRRRRSSSQERLLGSAKRRLGFGTDAAVATAAVSASAAARFSLATEPVTSSSSWFEDQPTQQLPRPQSSSGGLTALYLWCFWIALLLVTYSIVTHFSYVSVSPLSISPSPSPSLYPSPSPLSSSSSSVFP